MSIFTIGHSNHSLSDFLAMLAVSGIDAIADVRSSPASARLPQFDRGALQSSLRTAGITYVFLGDALGGRPGASLLTPEGHADYERMALEPRFRAGIDRVLRGGERYTLALMCSEAEPSECHRALLIARELATRGTEVSHILRGGAIEPHSALESRLLEMARLDHEDFFTPPEARLAQAYRWRAGRFAWRTEQEEDAA